MRRASRSSNLATPAEQEGVSPESTTDRVREPRLHDLEPGVATMRNDVLAGLRCSPKHLPSQYLYDDRGARLFELICEQPEYYITRTEIAILESNMDSIADRVGPHALLIEPGSGEGTKSALLLNGLSKPAGFVPIDISRAQLVTVARTIADRFPDIEVTPVCADFTDDPEIPSLSQPVRRRVAFLPGSTIGNLVPEGAVDVLRHLRTLCGERGFVLIGVDLKKPRRIVEPAYDDAAGVSRDFALNYLRRLNAELGASFNLAQFEYEAPYDPKRGRVEMALVSRRDQTARIGRARIHFRAGERIRTEYSYKYGVGGFLGLAERAGLNAEKVWTDPARLFAVMLLKVA